MGECFVAVGYFLMYVWFLLVGLSGTPMTIKPVSSAGLM
jgi:hypothetical protein